MITIMKLEDNLSSDNKLRMSQQRRVILDVLKRTHCHPTADEVYEMVRRRLPHISLGTVYRNLEILSSRGMIRKLQLGSAQRRFDGNTENHYHIRCLRCGRVDDVSVEMLDPCEQILREKCNYEIVGHWLEFIGVCPQCQKEKGGHDAA